MYEMPGLPGVWHTVGTLEIVVRMMMLYISLVYNLVFPPEITSWHVLCPKYSSFSWLNCGFCLELLADLDDHKGRFPNIEKTRDSDIEIPCLA